MPEGSGVKVVNTAVFGILNNFLILPEGLVAINGEEVGGWARKNRKRRKCFQQLCEGAVITLFRRSGIRISKVSQSIRVQVLPFATPA
jgi:hypothetical protein